MDGLKMEQKDENKGVFSNPEIFGGKLKLFRKGSDSNDPKNYRDPMPDEIIIYEKRERERKEKEQLKLKEDKDNMAELDQKEKERLKREEVERINKEIEMEKNLAEAVKALPETRKELKGLKEGQEKVCTDVGCLMKKMDEFEKKIEGNKVTCQNCGDKVGVGSSFCQNCGEAIEEWNDDKGYPMDPHWLPYWKRHGVSEVHPETETPGHE